MTPTIAKKAHPQHPVDLMFRAFSDPVRLRILHLLQSGEFCVGDIVKVLRLPQPRVSRHLAYLRRAGLVKVRQNGLWKFYSLAAITSMASSKARKLKLSSRRRAVMALVVFDASRAQGQ